MGDSNEQVEHYATITMRAQARPVYDLLTRFEDYPKFLRFVEAVVSAGDGSSHWQARLLGHHTWDAENAHWIAGEQVGWRVTSGWGFSGRIRVQDRISDGQIRLHVFLSYTPVGGMLGDLADELFFGRHVERRLAESLRRFAIMVEHAPAGALEPDSPRYLFRQGDGAARERQAAMSGRSWPAR